MMTNPELQQAWQDHVAEQTREQKAELAEEAHARECQQRLGIARETALALTDAVGWQESDLAIDRIYDTRHSNLVPLGPLDETGTKFGFGQVRIAHAKERKEVSTERRYRSPKVEHVYVPTDKLEKISVMFYAGDENGDNAKWFSYDGWSVPDRDDEEKIASIEHGLAIIAEALDQQKPTE